MVTKKTKTTELRELKARIESLRKEWERTAPGPLRDGLYIALKTLDGKA